MLGRRRSKGELAPGGGSFSSAGRNGWAATDLRFRKHPSDHHGSSPRGFLEDYGDDDDDDDHRGAPFLPLFGGGNTQQQAKRRRTALGWLWRCRSFRIHAGCLSAVAIATSLATYKFYGTTNLLHRASSSLTIFMTLILLLQNRRLRVMGTLRQTHNALRRQIHYLWQERERLHRTLDRLDQTVADLHHIPHDLHKATKATAAHQVNDLLSLVGRLEELQERIRKGLQQKIHQEVLSVVVKADRDQNWELGDREIDRLCLKLQHMEGIDFSEAVFRRKLREDNSVAGILAILRSITERDDEYEATHHRDSCFRFQSAETMSEIASETRDTKAREAAAMALKNAAAVAAAKEAMEAAARKVPRVRVSVTSSTSSGVGTEVEHHE